MNEHDASPPDHGSHTHEVVEGVVVGVDARDVFVELGPRRQGVIARSAFGEAPVRGDRHQFILHGREESLWVLSLAGTASLASWEEAEAGQLLSARVLRLHEEGFQLKVGPLHAWMPRSQSGLPKGHPPEELIGRTVQVEVLEVDPRHQRIIVSRKSALRSLKTGGLPSPGERVRGRVVRVEDYGAFVQLGCGRQGLLHVSNMSHDQVEDPLDLVQPGESIEAVVLHVREGGRRTALGLKQLVESPFSRLARTAFEGQLVEGVVERFIAQGALVRVEPGVTGLLPEGQGPTSAALRTLLKPGERRSLRILQLDPERERLTLSLLHADGRVIAREEAQLPRSLEDLAEELGAEPRGTNLGRLLRRALD